ncbi:MAG TPA: NrfD/PsrC family molybdoenzyme membrane anchor subunit [Rubrobacteraceae bacterium]|nr:NrfD/PsrC family molybdoenzyme membrane anchor subunit [Rubrobacteraceae bacterium]
MTDTTRATPDGRVETSHHPRTDPERDGRDYYGIPPIKEHTWTWEVPVYFWLGGIGSGAHVTSAIARALGNDDTAFLRASRYITLLTMILSPVLLIMDLGRPERFYNMLRIVKWRSPMSMGTWALTVFSLLTGTVAASQAARDGLLGRDNVLARLVGAIPARFLSVLALPFGYFVGAYTGVLLAMTSVPMWARNAVLLGPTFLSSALSTGLSAVSFVLHLGGWGERRTLEALRRAERMTLVVEAALIAASLAQMGRWSKPLFSKKLAPLFVGGTLVGGLAAPFALLSGRETRGKSLLASVLALLGGLAFRFAMIEGGRLSARDPQATFTFARKENLPIPEENVQDGHASG